MGCGSSHRPTIEDRIKRLPYIPQKKIRDYVIAEHGLSLHKDELRFLTKLNVFMNINNFPRDYVIYIVIDNQNKLRVSYFPPNIMAGVKVVCQHLFNRKEEIRLRRLMDVFFGTKFVGCVDRWGDYYWKSEKTMKTTRLFYVVHYKHFAMIGYHHPNEIRYFRMSKDGLIGEYASKNEIINDIARETTVNRRYLSNLDTMINPIMVYSDVHAP
jgi:hypothetical protein